MGIGNKKNILMTTMSTLKDVNKVNYYFVSEAGETGTLFCDGISAVENGSKYILSKYPIDEILVVGSAETFCQNDNREVENLLDESNWKYLYNEWVNDYHREIAKRDGKGISAFGFYKLRMAEFICQKDAISTETVSRFVSEEGRREWIKGTVSNVLVKMQEEEHIEQSEEYIIQCMKLPEKSMALLQNIRQEIETNIKESFEKEDSYLEYISRKKILYTERIDIALKSQKYQKLHEEIEQDKSLSILEREFLFVSLQRKIDALYHNKEKIHLEAEAEKLRKENANLQYQIQNLKNQRVEKELAFAKYVIYHNLDQKNIMKPCTGMQDKIFLQFIPEKTSDDFDNITGIVNEIYRVSKETECVNLFVDMQGGSRTSGYVRNAVLSILSNQETNCIKIGEIVATEFNPQGSWVSRIVNETDRYRIHDLVSGMNAFIRYGKADMLVKYCEDMAENQDSRTRRLVDGMKQVDDAISLCDPTRLEQGMRNLMRIINQESRAEENYVSNLFQAMEDGIKKDYNKFFSNSLEKKKIDYLELVDWCLEKRLIQQALTVIEDKIPEIILEKFVKIEVAPQFSYSNNYEYLQKLTKVLFNRNSPQGDEKNILFYGLTKKIGELWKCEDGSRYNDDDKQKLGSFHAQEEIAENYYMYMLGNWQLRENARNSDLPEILKNLAHDETTNPYKTLAGLKAGTYELNDNAGNSIELDVRFKVASKRQDLEKLLLLHAALKQERNNCNHASEQKKRLPLEIVSQAIQEYVKRFHELLGIK